MAEDDLWWQQSPKSNKSPNLVTLRKDSQNATKSSTKQELKLVFLSARMKYPILLPSHSKYPHNVDQCF